MNRHEKTATEHVMIKGLGDFIEEVIEYSDPIHDIQNSIHEAEVNIDRNHDYAIQHADDIQNNLECEIEDLKSEIESLKDMIESLREG
jgi:peptidoglycan hydrolase CwlO-like protein